MKAFTIVEIMVSVVIMSAMIIGLLQVFEAGQNVYYSNQALMEKQRVIQQVLGSMSRELRQARISDITISSGNSEIDFVIPVDTDPLTYSSNIEYSLVNGQIVREHPANTESVLATNVNSMTFTLTGDILEIEIQATVGLRTEDITFTVKEMIALRS